PATLTGEPGAALKPPAPSPSSTETSFEVSFATARSGLPSPLRSAATTEDGARPTSTGEPGAALKPHAPSPIRTVTSFESWFATARSGLPSPLRSAATTEDGLWPTGIGPPGANDGSAPPAPVAPATRTASRQAEAARAAERRSLVRGRALGVGAGALVTISPRLRR